MRGGPPAQLNEWQRAFCEWSAERLHLSLQESQDRFRRSCAALRGGHGGRAFKLYCELHHDLYQPFVSSNPGEIHLAYQLHAPLHFLRMLSYGVPSWPSHLPELSALFTVASPLIIDFGCGLAQKSISLALHLRSLGRAPRLFLADLPTPQLEFLRWFCARLRLPAGFAECTPSQPVPPLPACDLCVALELLEHVHHPLAYLKAFEQATRSGGFLWTNLEDHPEEFLHVSPGLAPLRKHLAELGWNELRPHQLYRKG